jgi:hypothetical protein
MFGLAVSSKGSYMPSVGIHKQVLNPDEILGFWNPGIKAEFELYSGTILCMRVRS